MARQVGRKGSFGRITTKLLKESVETKEQNVNGEKGISKAGKYALEIRNSRRFFGLGRHVVIKSPFRTTKNLRSIDLERILANSGSRFVSYNKNQGIRLSKGDSSIQNKLYRYFYNGVKHLTAYKKKNSLVPEKFVGQVKEAIGKTIESLSTNLSPEEKNTLDRYQNTLENLVKLQMSHYSHITGRRNLKLENLVRISSVVDAILEDLKMKVEQKESLSLDYMYMLEEWIIDISKHGGDENVNNFFHKMYKEVLKQRVQKDSKENAVPQNMDEISFCIYNMKKMLIEENQLNGTSFHLNGNVFLQKALYQALEDSIGRLDLPISHYVGEQLLNAINRLRAILGMSSLSSIAEIIPKEGILDGASKRVVEQQNTVALSYIDYINLISSRLSGEYKSKADIENVIKQIAGYIPYMASVLRFADVVQMYIQTGQEYIVQNAVEKGEELGKEFQASEYFIRNGIESVLDSNDSNGLLESGLKHSLENIKNKLTTSINQESLYDIESSIKSFIAKDNTSPSAIRRKKITKRIYNVLFGKTFVGQAVRTTAKVGLTVGGGVLTGMTLPGALLNPGGNALLQMIHMAEIKKLGFSLGITAAGLLPTFLSPLRRDTSHRKIRKIAQQQYKAKSKYGRNLSQRLKKENKREVKEKISIDSSHKKHSILSQRVAELYRRFQEIQLELSFAQGIGGEFILFNLETIARLEELDRDVNIAIEELSNSRKEDIKALKQMQRELFLISCLRNVEGELYIQRAEGKLLHNTHQYVWNTEQFPADNMTNKEASILSGLYLLSRVSRDLLPKTRFNNQLEYREKLLESRVLARLGNTSDLKLLVNSLDQYRVDYIKNKIEKMKKQFPKEFERSELANKLYAQMKQMNVISSSDQDINESISTDDIPLESLENITERELTNAIKHGTFVELLKRMLQLYAPYTNKPIPIQGLQSIYSFLNNSSLSDMSAYKGSLLTEVVASALSLDKNVSENSEVIRWLLAHGVEKSSSGLVLAKDISLKKEFIEQTSNLPLRQSKNPEHMLLEEFKTLERSLDSKANSGGIKDEVSVSGDSDSVDSLEERAQGYSRDIINDSIFIGNLDSLLDARLLEYTYQNGMLGEIAHALVRIATPKDMNQRGDSQWIASLYSALDGIQSKYRAPLYGLVAIEIYEQVLRFMNNDINKRVLLTKELLQKISYGDGIQSPVLFKSEVTFDKAHIATHKNPSSLWKSNNLEKDFSKILASYMIQGKNYNSSAVPPLGYNQSPSVVRPTDSNYQVVQEQGNEKSPARRLGNMLEGAVKVLPTSFADSIVKQKKLLNRENQGNNEKLHSLIPQEKDSLLPADLSMDVNKKLEESLIEDKVLLEIYHKIKNDYQSLEKDGILTSSVHRVENSNHTLRILATYIMLDSLRSWGYMPGKYSSLQSNQTLTEDINQMLANMKHSLIGVSLLLGVKKLDNGKEEQVFVNGDHLIANSSSFKTHITNNVFIKDEKSNESMLFSKQLASYLISFAESVYKMNSQRSIRQRLLSQEGKFIDLVSTQVGISDLAQSLLIQYPYLREVMEQGTKNK